METITKVYLNIYAAVYKTEKMEYEGITKIVKRLEEKGLVEKKYLSGNRKSMTVTVNKNGKSLYNAYSEKICAWHFSPMFEHFQKIPPQYRPYVRDALYASMDGSDFAKKDLHS